MQNLTPEVAVFLAFEINDYLSETNQYFQDTGFVLDDLNVYAKSLATIDRTIMNEAEDLIRPVADEQIVAMYRKAVEDTRELHAAMDAENVAA